MMSNNTKLIALPDANLTAVEVAELLSKNTCIANDAVNSRALGLTLPTIIFSLYVVLTATLTFAV